ncbi:MAG: carboxypeptidase-like regulatory domain-containing protein [Acidobacteria bacterium]|nr:carboxypeptidase-like regulatory domain-containing protein [Acidobacteriota bacterium]
MTVTVRDRERGGPIEGAEVRIGLYRARSDAAGCALLDVPAGEHDVSTRKAGYEPYAGRVTVAGDVALRIDAERADADLDDDQVWM